MVAFLDENLECLSAPVNFELRYAPLPYEIFKDHVVGTNLNKCVNFSTLRHYA